MDWMRSVIGNDGKGKAKPKEAPPTRDSLSEAFDAAMEEAQKFLKALIDRGQRYIDRNQPIEATILIFAAVLCAAGKAKVAVHNANKKSGVESNAINDTWNAIEACMFAKDEEEAKEAMAKFTSDLIKRRKDDGE